MTQFSDTTNLQGIVEGVTFRTGADTLQFTTKDRTRYANEAYSRLANIIIQADGRMQWDDSNHTDQPTTFTALVANQKDYNVFSAAPTALQDWLTIERVSIKDPSGIWRLLTPIDKRDLSIDNTEFAKASGIPRFFDMVGTSIQLYPASNYSASASLKFDFQRAPSYFVATDTTKQPGIATIFHPYFEIYVSNIWNGTKKGDWSLQPIIDKMEREVGSYYNKRNQVEEPRITRAYKRFK